MTDYRVVARHVGYWRGVPHKWSTVYPLTGSLNSSDYQTVLTAMHDLEQGMNYPDPVQTVGGLWETVLYDKASGGVPVAVQSYFDPATPGSWILYSGAGWTSITQAAERPLETALQVSWKAGLSKTGKPVLFRKWYHAVKISGSNGAGPDVSSGDVTSLAAYAQAKLALVTAKGVSLGNGSRLASATATVSSHYGNHQMPRGRRKKIAATGAQGSQILQILESKAYQNTQG